MSTDFKFYYSNFTFLSTKAWQNLAKQKEIEPMLMLATAYVILFFLLQPCHLEGKPVFNKQLFMY
jgi:hypothetical protein